MAVRGSCDIFFGGLPPIASFAEVEKTISNVGDEVLRFQFRQECGYGVIRFSNTDAATKACQLLTEVNGHPVAAHLLRADTAEWENDGARPPTQAAESSQASINHLLHLLRKGSSRQADVDAALLAAGSVQRKAESAAMPASLLVAQPSPTVDALHISGDSAGVADQQVDAGIHSQEAQADPNPLSTYPRCKHLIEVYRALPGAQNKTPLAVLHEYATRLNLELTYSEQAESNLGPFTVEAKLLSVDRATLYSSGTGKGRGKKEAKQAAAAAVLETLLANVPLEDFLHRPTKQQQKRAQASPTSATVRTANGARDALQTQLGARQEVLLGSPQPPLADSLATMPQPIFTPGLLGSPPAYSFHSQPSLTFPDVAGPDMTGTSPTWFGNMHRPPDGMFHNGPYAYGGAPMGSPLQGPPLQGPPLQGPPMQGPGYQLAAANAAAMYKRSHDAMSEAPEGLHNGGG